MNTTKDLIALEADRLEWSKKTFPEATPLGSLNKARSELNEIEFDILTGNRNPEEYADALMCLFDSAGRQGITPDEIIEAFAAKLEKNKSRDWTPNGDGSYSHVKPPQQ